MKCLKKKNQNEMNKFEKCKYSRVIQNYIYRVDMCEQPNPGRTESGIPSLYPNKHCTTSKKVVL